MKIYPTKFQKYYLSTIAMILLLGINTKQLQAWECDTGEPFYTEYNYQSQLRNIEEATIRVHLFEIHREDSTFEMNEGSIEAGLDIMLESLNPNSIFVHFATRDTIYSDSLYYFLEHQRPFELLLSHSYDTGINMFYLPNIAYGPGFTGYGQAFVMQNGVVATDLFVAGYECVNGDEPCLDVAETFIPTHELGHCLGLYHTHDPRFGKENVIRPDEPPIEDCNLNCDYAGDILCGTNASLSLKNYVTFDFESGNCIYNETDLDSCGQLYNPQLDNIMSYTNVMCGNAFVNDQIDRMFSYLDTCSVLQPFIIPYDNRIFSAGWNWVSFPRLFRTNDNPVEAESVFDYQNLDGLIDTVLHENDYMVFDTSWIHFGLDSIKTTLGYKLFLDDSFSEYSYHGRGDTVSYDTETTLYAGEENWVGYFIPYSQRIIDAIPVEVYDHLTSIKSKNWYRIKVGNNWRIRFTNPFYGPDTFDYGKLYIFTIDSTMTFHWEANGSTPPYPILRSEDFGFIEKPDYEAIFIESVDGVDNVDEIGAFVGEVCVGACKVEGYPAQILAYTNGFEDQEITFQITTNDGLGKSLEQSSTSLETKVVSNQGDNILIAGEQDFSSVSLLVEDFPSSFPDEFILYQNYPNPFNPTTKIRFSLPSDSKVRIDIYNILGEHVNFLEDSYLSTGSHTVVWNTSNNEGTFVTSGIYFYSVIVDDKIFQRKMILLK